MAEEKDQEAAIATPKVKGTWVTVSVFKPTGFELTFFVPTKNRWMAAKRAVEYLDRYDPASSHFLNDIHLTLGNYVAERRCVVLDALESIAP